MEKLLRGIENIVRKFEISFCEIIYVFFFEDEIDIKIYEREPIFKEGFDKKYMNHRNQIAKEINKRFSNKIKSMELYPHGSEICSFNGVKYCGIELVINLNKVKKLNDDKWIIIY